MIPELTNEEYEIIKRLVNYTIALNKNSGVDGYYSKIISPRPNTKEQSKTDKSKYKKVYTEQLTETYGWVAKEWIERNPTPYLESKRWEYLHQSLMVNKKLIERKDFKYRDSKSRDCFYRVYRIKQDYNTYKKILYYFLINGEVKNFTSSDYGRIKFQDGETAIPFINIVATGFFSSMLHQKLVSQEITDATNKIIYEINPCEDKNTIKEITYIPYSITILSKLFQKIFNRMNIMHELAVLFVNYLNICQENIKEFLYDPKIYIEIISKSYEDLSDNIKKKDAKFQFHYLQSTILCSELEYMHRKILKKGIPEERAEYLFYRNELLPYIIESGYLKDWEK